MQRASVDLPQPDSPTRPSVSPSSTVRLTPSTACRCWPRPAMPPPIGKCLRTSVSSRSGGMGPPSQLRRSVEPAGVEVSRSRRTAGRAGGVSSQRACAYAQRARNEQPSPSPIERGRLARRSSADGSVRCRSMRGNRLEQPPACTGAAGRWKRSRTVPCSTMRPAYITATRSAMRATTPRSCVISTTAAPCVSRMRWISRRIWAWIVTSSAVVGSSAISTAGSHASAIAIITRWRMPPENWWG